MTAVEIAIKYEEGKLSQHGTKLMELIACSNPYQRGRLTGFAPAYVKAYDLWYLSKNGNNITKEVEKKL